MKQLYNETIKEEYLSTLPENTAKIYRYAFYRSFDHEDMLKKDLYDFTTEEVIDVIKSANHSTLNSIKLTFNVFENYIDWAAKYRVSNINPLSSVNLNELKAYLDTSKKLFLSEDELIELENQMVNAQDKICFRLIFEGALGHKNSELINLTSNCVIGNKLKLKDDKRGEREITVSDRCLELIEAALNEEEYYTKNGTSETRRGAFEVISGDHVIRSTKTGRVNAEGGKADTHAIYRRMTTIKELFNLPYLNPKNVRSSGMIKMAKDLYERHGKLENEQLSEIAEHFGVQKVVMNGYEIYNYSYLRETINAENIMDLYGVNIEG
ncbi:hypothetical protein COE51_01325 [Bacillus pseudomycoides]|nr:hypothetical protein COE51_01325 [Bacillus pseudomycoides]